jgi:hypothetical protein
MYYIRWGDKLHVVKPLVWVIMDRVQTDCINANVMDQSRGCVTFPSPHYLRHERKHFLERINWPSQLGEEVHG